MKKHHSIPALALVLALSCALVTGCSSDSSSYDSSSSSSSSSSSTPSTTVAPESSAENYYTGTTVDTTSSQYEGLKLVYEGNINLETQEFDTVNQGLSDLVAELGGYFSNSAVSTQSNDYRYGSYTLRIPAEHFDTFFVQVGQLATTTQVYTTVEDISEEYYDTASRLETQQIKLERLQDLLSQAEVMEDIITLESAISDTQWEIDNLSGQVRQYDSLVNFSTIEVFLSEVYQLTDVQEAPLTFGDRIATGLAQGGQSFLNGLENFVVFLAYQWTVILVLVVIGGGVLTVTIRRKKAREVPSESSKNPDDPT